jgi:O-methyltransferase
MNSDFPFSPPRGATRRERVDQRLATLLQRVFTAGSFPFAVLFLLYNRRIDPAYAMSWPRKIALARKMYRNARRVPTLTSYKAHLAMAVKLLEIPPKVEGVVVECGCYLGGSTANLSLICDIVGRELVVYDSFEGLPPAQPGDKYANEMTEGFLKADLEAVMDNVRRLGVIERCTFRKGWFSDTLPAHDRPIVLCFLDVDYQASLHDCIINLWPHLTQRGYVFIDEYVYTDYCALFYSEKYWRKYFQRKPPGLVGAGSGIGLGDFYLGPLWQSPTLQGVDSVAYTRKDFSGHWNFYPDDADAS